MTHRLPNGTVVLCVEAPRHCTDCGRMAECRPYGKDGAVVCFDCASKDMAEMERQMSKMLGVPPRTIQ